MVERFGSKDNFIKIGVLMIAYKEKREIWRSPFGSFIDNVKTEYCSIYATYLDMTLRNRDRVSNEYSSRWLCPKWVDSYMACDDYRGKERIVW